MMSTTIDRHTIEQAVEDTAATLGHDLRLTTFEDGNPVWRCVNGCGVERVKLSTGVGWWTLENRPVGRCDK